MTGLEQSLIILIGLVIPCSVGLVVTTAVQSHFTPLMAKLVGGLLVSEITLLLILANV
jgi:hypothetical protein